MNNFIIDTNPSKEEWNKFVFNHKYGNIFQTYEMYKVYKASNYKTLIISIKNYDGDIKGLLLAVIYYVNNFKYFTSRSVILGGPLVIDNDKKITKIILDEYNKRLNKNVIFSQIRNFFDWDENKGIFLGNNFFYKEHLNILHNLSLKPVEDQFKDIHKGRRKNIRRAKRKGLKFCELKNEDELKTIYKIIRNDYRRIKLPVPDYSFFHNCKLLLDKKIKIFAAKLDNEIIATRIILCYNGVVYDWYAGSKTKHLDKYPNDFLPWKIIEWSSLNGFFTFDFGGAGKPDIPYGVRDHKLKFGGKLVEYGRFEKIHKKRLYQLGKFILTAYKRLKK